MIDTNIVQDNAFKAFLKTGDTLAVFFLQVTGEIGESFLLNFLQVWGEKNLNKIKKDTANVTNIQNKVLLDILKLNADTEYGRKYDFSSIRSIDQFRDVHPLTTYKNYRSIIEDISITGNFTKLLAEPITLFQETSGTTGKTKLIPRTNRLSSTFMEAFLATDALASACFQKRISVQNRLGLALIHTFPVQNTPSGIMKGTATSGGLQDSLEKFELAKKYIELKFCSPSSAFLIPNSEAAYYCHLLFALQKENITFITANFASDILEAVQVMEKNKQQLVDDVCFGKLNKNIDLPKNIRYELEKNLKPNPQRATMLENIFQQGTERIFPRIWTNLTNIQCITSGTMQIYKENLKYYTGEIPYYSAIYGASEAWIGANLEPYRQNPGYTVIPCAAYFEFIPVENIDEEQPLTVNLTSLEVGKSYEVVITNISGLYRYRLGDIIKCIGFYNQAPTLEFLYRTGSLLNLAGEKVSEDTVATALFEASKLFGESFRITEYTTRTEFSSRPWKYVIYIEVLEASTVLSSLDLYRNKVEKTVSKLNQSYSNLKTVNTLDSIEIKLLKKDAFKKFRKKLLSQNNSAAQFKMPRLLKQQEDIKFLENMVLAQSN